MPCAPRLLLIGLLLAAAGSASADEPWFNGDDVHGNGEVSRRIWKPEFARAEAGGVHLSVGLAIGLRGAVRHQLGRRATPALTMELRQGTSVSLLPAGDGQAMLVWSQPLR